MKDRFNLILALAFLAVVALIGGAFANRRSRG